MDKVIAIQGYQMFRRDRLDRRGGGVAIYTKAAITATICEVQDDPRVMELLLVRLETRDGIVLVGALYHPPRPFYDTAALLNFVERSLEELLRADIGALVLLGGDFNQLNNAEISIRTSLVKEVAISLIC